MNDKQTVKSTQKGGFIQGLPVPVAQPTNTGGCCGTSSGTGDCCEESSSGGGGCCGESASDINTSTSSCCG
jgi:hypothetical protein